MQDQDMMRPNCSRMACPVSQAAASTEGPFASASRLPKRLSSSGRYEDLRGGLAGPVQVGVGRDAPQSGVFDRRPHREVVRPQPDS